MSRAPMIRPAAVRAALTRLEGSPVEITYLGPVAEDRAATEHKQIGYGEPMIVRYRTAHAEKRAVLHTMSPNWFGHDRRSDRAALVLLAADTFAEIPRHTSVLDVGAFDAQGELTSLKGSGELYLLTEYADGALYAHDLRGIETSGEATPLDVQRAGALASYLAELHGARIDAAPEVYRRAVRDLVGSGEGFFGIADGYPEDGPVDLARIVEIEHRMIDARWRLRRRASRLRRTHGDFHPYNILFREGVDFTLLDASRGCRGDPADDVAALTVNYVFGAVLCPSAWPRGVRPIWDAFWSVYLERSGDTELLDVLPAFFAWRALVVASPVWYPALTPAVRDRLLGIAEASLDAERFDLDVIAKHLGG